MILPLSVRRWVFSALVMLAACSSVQAADIIKGRQLYAANCALCHGQQGQSTMPGAPNLNRGSNNLLHPDFTLLKAIRSGKNAMPAFQGMMADRDIMDVIAYLRTLR